jgi:hypothetical protein
LARSFHNAFVQTYQAFSERGFWFLQAFGGQFARAWLEEDRSIREGGGGTLRIPLLMRSTSAAAR